MNVILIKEVERLAHRRPVHVVLIVEDNGTEDGGRIIARVTRYADALAIVQAMEWNIISNEFDEDYP